MTFKEWWETNKVYRHCQTPGPVRDAWSAGHAEATAKAVKVVAPAILAARKLIDGSCDDLTASEAIDTMRAGLARRSEAISRMTKLIAERDAEIARLREELMQVRTVVKTSIDLIDLAPTENNLAGLLNLAMTCSPDFVLDTNGRWKKREEK